METTMKVYYYGGELYHHGIQGQKWGVRRYQNEDGSLTEEGKKRYLKYGSRQKQIENLKNADLLTEHSKDTKRLNKAATTGLIALEGKDADLSYGNKEWFLWEDQTIGYATVADLANRGFTKDQIKSLIKQAENVYFTESGNDGEKLPEGVFQLAENSSISDKFIQDCINVQKK